MVHAEANRIGPLNQSVPDDDALAQLVPAILGMRRRRSDLFGQELFADHAWDILLILLEARIAKGALTLVEISRTIDMRQSSAARWVEVLVQRGHVECIDRETELYRLSEHGVRSFRRLAQPQRQ